MYDARIVIDGANGVGAVKAAELVNYVKPSLSMSIYNDGSQGKLNHKVHYYL